MFSLITSRQGFGQLVKSVSKQNFSSLHQAEAFIGAGIGDTQIGEKISSKHHYFGFLQEAQSQSGQLLQP